MLIESESFFLTRIKESLGYAGNDLTNDEERLLVTPYGEIEKSVGTELARMMLNDPDLSEEDFEAHKNRRADELVRLKNKCVVALRSQYDLEIATARDIQKMGSYGTKPVNAAWEWRRQLKQLDRNSNRLLVAVVSEWYQRGGGRLQEKHASGCALRVVLLAFLAIGFIVLAALV